MRRLTLLPLAMLALLVAAAPAAADSTYRTERLPLKDANGGVFGMVVNAHPNGPQIYAHEQYLLRGAEANSTYDVWLLVGGDCASLGRFRQTASITTNAAGNGAADYFFTFEEIDSLGVRGATLSGAWQVVDEDGDVVYQTDCTSIELD